MDEETRFLCATIQDCALDATRCLSSYLTCSLCKDASVSTEMCLTPSIMPGKNYPPKVCAQIVEAVRYETQEVVASRFKCSHSTVSRIVKKHKKTGKFLSPPRPGRPSTLSLCDHARIQRLLLKYNTLSPSEILLILNELGYTLSISTLHRFMKQHSLGRFIAREKPYLSPKARRLRRDYAHKRRGDDLHCWRRTIYVDELPAGIGGSSMVYVTRRKGEAWRERNMVPKLQIKGVGCMLWGGV